MNLSSRTHAYLARLAWPMAWFGLVTGQLHALSRFATAAGHEDLELPLTAAWAVPTAELLRPLLDWADPDTVYLTYGKLWLFVVVAFTAAAWVAYLDRRPTGIERMLWWMVVSGQGLATVSIVVFYWFQWTSYSPALEAAYEWLSLPAFMLTILGSTALGVVLLARRFHPRATAVLLASALPLAIGITMVTSLGNALLPLAFAWAWAARRVASRAPEPSRDPTTSAV